MMLSLGVLLGALLTVAACFALGTLLIGRLGVRLDRGEGFPLAFILGAACLHLAIFALLALKIAYWPVVIGLLLVLVWCRPKGVLCSSNSVAQASSPALALFIPFALLAFFHAWAPESSADGAGYHLGMVARYFRAHGFERITTNLYASLSGGVEMLFLPAFIIGRHSAAALVHFAFAIALALAMLAYGRRIGKPWVGVAGAFLTFASPIVGVDGSSAYNDVAVAAVAFSVFYWLEIWDESRADLLLIPVGLLAGYAYAVKYTAFVMLLFAVVFVLWRSRSWKAILLVTACAATMIAPWMIKNWIYVRNPIAPFGNAIFRNPYVHISFEQAYTENLRHYKPPNKWTLPLEATMRGANTGGIVGPVFLAAPLALLALRQRAGRRLLAAGGLLLATYFLNIENRMLIPCLPFFSLAMALSLDFSPPLLLVVMLFHAITSWPTGIRVYASPSVWSLNRMLYREALRIVPQDVALRRASDTYSLARMIEFNVPKGERVLAMEEVPFSYTSREVLVGFESAFNEELRDILDAGWNEDQQPTVRHIFRFPATVTSRVRLVATAPVKRLSRNQWGVHELRFYNQGVELPRRPEWRLQAWPNPWDVQLAFDNSPATRWRSWEPAKPGMYLEADFGRQQTVDQVNVETCADDSGIQTIIQVLDDKGNWRPVGGQAAEDNVKLRGNIRRAATYELHVRGVNYLLLRDTDYGAEDIRDDPESWGLKEIAAGFGARIYQVIL
jgi:hypothetical protein